MDMSTDPLPVTTLASLGMSCQSAHQLARFAETRNDVLFQKGPIDWLICPPDSLTHWLDAGLPSFSAGEIEERREHAYWPRFDFWFWHGFYTRKDEMRLLEIPDNEDRELEKLEYQRNRFSALNPMTTLFVWSNSQNNLFPDVFRQDEAKHYRLTDARIERIEESLDQYFGNECRVLFVTRDDRCDPSALSRANVFVLPEEQSEWKGADQDWNRILAAELTGSDYPEAI